MVFLLYTEYRCNTVRCAHRYKRLFDRKSFFFNVSYSFFYFFFRINTSRLETITEAIQSTQAALFYTICICNIHTFVYLELQTIRLQSVHLVRKSTRLLLLIEHTCTYINMYILYIILRHQLCSCLQNVWWFNFFYAINFSFYI